MKLTILYLVFLLCVLVAPLQCKKDIVREMRIKEREEKKRRREIGRLLEGDRNQQQQQPTLTQQNQALDETIRNLQERLARRNATN